MNDEEEIKELYRKYWQCMIDKEAVGRGLQRAIDEAIIKKWLDEVL